MKKSEGFFYSAGGPLRPVECPSPQGEAIETCYKSIFGDSSSIWQKVAKLAKSRGTITRRPEEKQEILGAGCGQEWLRGPRAIHRSPKLRQAWAF